MQELGCLQGREGSCLEQSGGALVLEAGQPEKLTMGAFLEVGQGWRWPLECWEASMGSARYPGSRRSIVSDCGVVNWVRTCHKRLPGR